MPIRVVIIDSHTLSRFGLRALAADHPEVEIVAECATMTEAPDVVETTRPDVVTIDVALADGNGLWLTRALRSEYPELGIVVLTSDNGDNVLFAALENGASAFVAKSAPLAEVVAAILHSAVAPVSFTASGLANALSKRRGSRERLALSQRELEVLHLLRDGQSIPAIARGMYISPSTAKTYVARLYEKLGAANRAQALMAAVRCGLFRHDWQPVIPPPREADYAAAG